MKYVGKIHTFRHRRTERLSYRLSLGELLEGVHYKIENEFKKEFTGPRNSGPDPEVRCQEIPCASGAAARKQPAQITTARPRVLRRWFLRRKKMNFLQ